MNALNLSQSAVHSGDLILVNAECPAPERGRPQTLVPAMTDEPNVLIGRKAANLLAKLLGAIHGWDSIAAVSGWRSMREQTGLYEGSMRENGPDFTRQYVALPGHSEHQTGLAIDLGVKGESIDFIRPDFPNRGVCLDFRRRAAEFGFVERYPAGKEHITGIAHEPWHFRYVGAPHAAIMARRGLVLEEYLEFLRRYPRGTRRLLEQSGNRRVAISFVRADAEGDTPIELEAYAPYTISGNNTDGFVVTEWEADHGGQ